ncbi:MAG: hypothetical protein V1743_06730 [Nanoarchaeota archaeon]
MAEDISESVMDGTMRVDRVIDGIILHADIPLGGRPQGWDCPPTHLLRMLWLGERDLLDIHYVSFSSTAELTAVLDQLYMGQRIELSKNDQYGLYTSCRILEQPEEPEEERIKLY